MGNDKTSWLDLDDEDDDLIGGGTTGGFTETIEQGPGGSGAAPTDIVTPQDVPGAPSPAQTVLDPGVEKTEFAMDDSIGFDEDVDPVVGWLVVIGGPGLGMSRSLGAGMNSVGRDPSERVALDFGDKQISGQDHLRILYDDANRAFYVAPGSGRTISRVNGQIIAQTMPLEDHAVLELSKKTKVHFVSFCGEAFDWSDLAEQES
ncbi:MAG: FHA domain-containing protein [Pseudomonadota bacterium]